MAFSSSIKNFLGSFFQEHCYWEDISCFKYIFKDFADIEISFQDRNRSENILNKFNSRSFNKLLTAHDFDEDHEKPRETMLFHIKFRSSHWGMLVHYYCEKLFHKVAVLHFCSKIFGAPVLLKAFNHSCGNSEILKSSIKKFLTQI